MPEPEPASPMGTSPADKAAARAAARAVRERAAAAPAAAPTETVEPAPEEVMFWTKMDPSAVATALHAQADIVERHASAPEPEAGSEITAL